MTSSQAGPGGTLRLTALAFAFGLPAQGLLGWLLAEGDFGVFAVAIGVGSLIFGLGDGGVRSYLIDRGRYASPNVHASAVWYSLQVSSLMAVALALLALLGGWLFDEPSVRSVLLIAAVASPLGFFAPIGLGLLRSHGHQRVAERLDGSALVAHYALVALFAALDLGATSFVLPLLITKPLLSLFAWLAVRRVAIPFGRASIRGVGRIARRSRPVLLVAAATGLLRHGPFAALGLAASVEVVGFFYFAYRLAMDSVLSLTAPVRWVLVPTFASMHGDPWRRRRAALDSFLVASLLIGTIPLLFTSLAGPLEAAVWRGRWQESVFSIQILGAAMAFEVVVVVALMLFESADTVRVRAALLAARGAGLLVVMGLVGWLAPPDSVDEIALASGLYLVLTGAMIVAFVVEALGLELKKVARAVGSVYLLTGAGTALALLTQLLLDDALSWVRLVAAGAVFLLVVIAGSQTFFESKLRRVATVIERTTGNRLLEKILRKSAATQSDGPA